MQYEEIEGFRAKWNKINAAHSALSDKIEKKLKAIDSKIYTSFEAPSKKIESDLNFILKHIVTILVEEKKIKIGTLMEGVNKKIFIEGDKVRYREYKRKHTQSFDLLDGNYFFETFNLPELEEFGKAIREMRKIKEQAETKLSELYNPKEDDGKVSSYSSYRQRSYHEVKKVISIFNKKYHPRLISYSDETYNDKRIAKRLVNNITLQIKRTYYGDFESEVLFYYGKNDGFKIDENAFTLIMPATLAEVNKAIGTYQEFLKGNHKLVNGFENRIYKIIEKYSFDKYLGLKGI